jgi:hypothetical protein
MATATANYGTDVAFTQTNLDGIASSSTWLSGWTSAAVDNTSTKAMDYIVSGEFQVESSGLSAGVINVYAYCSLNDTPTWPDIFSAGTEGTEGTATLHDTEVRDTLRLVASITTDTSASRKYPFFARSICAVFGTPVPPTHWALFVAQSTGTTLETTGDPNQIYYMPVKVDVA